MRAYYAAHKMTHVLRGYTDTLDPRGFVLIDEQLLPK